MAENPFVVQVDEEVECAGGTELIEEEYGALIKEEVFIKSVFDKFDTDQNGHVDPAELQEKLGEECIVTPEIVKEAVESCDQDGDGKINLNEFINMVCKHKRLFHRHVHRYIKILVEPHGKGRRFVLTRRTTLTGSYEDLVKVKKYTLGMFILSLLQIIIYFTPWQHWLIFTPEHRLQMWRYFSYMFTHNSLNHLGINIFFQLLVGFPLETVHSWRVLIIYGAGILGGCLVQSFIYPYNDLAGASPGVYAILTAHISKILMNFRELTNPIAQLIAFGLFTVFDTIYNYFTYWNNEEVSYISHLGGALCGLLMGVIILKNIVKKPHETYLWYIALILYSALMGFLVGLEIRYILLNNM